MEITVQSSKAVKPAYGGGDTPAAAVVPLTVFDLISFDDYMFSIHAFHPPSPDNAALEEGLARALAEYREWAGRLCADPASGRRWILLNDAGVRFVEATADATLDSVMPLQPTPEVQRLHPSADGAEELMLVQVTRFACGSLVVGHTMHHAVGDGFAISQFLVAWGQATRGVPIDPVPVHDRTSCFVPRDPPRIEFEHRGAEFMAPREKKKENVRSNDGDAGKDDDKVVIQQVRFTREFISELKSRASAGMPRPYSTTQCLAAHLWRCMTKARGLDGGQATSVHLAVNGRARMSPPRVPVGYTGNVVLWAHPTTTAGELLADPLGRATQLIRGEVARVDDAYFRSFIDFASSGAVEEEGLVPASGDPEALGPNVAVYCLLRIPFYDMDFGGGRQFFYTPGYYPAEGVVYILPPSPLGDGSVEAHVSLFSRAVETFKGCCFSMEQPEVVLQ
ncbi:Agmatine coumaroyltransferase-2 [Dichanthelium oligosanthes]|uniref:Agmatine coumaroyltransferase-2 n=1 Tax=Dichanthelium oligosanthes TaxID=888268 RepID=A0A1E5V832_9POAL|nr:Agmatine coumaroyltransferase-2 [Dichanthelium oligosanthes]